MSGFSCSSGKPGFTPVGELLRVRVPGSVRIELIEVFSALAVCQLAGGCPAASNFLLRRQKKVTKEKATRWSGSLRFAAGNLRCSPKAGSRSNSASPQTIASPDPLLPALLGPARREGDAENQYQCGETGRAKRVLSESGFSTRIYSPTPSACAEERRSSRIRASDCLSAASSSSTLAGPSTAGCPAAKRRGRRQRGRLFFAYSILAKQKKMSSRRATPGLPEAPQSPALAKALTGAAAPSMNSNTQSSCN